MCCAIWLVELLPISNELHASFYVISKLPQAMLQWHKCSDLSRHGPRSQKPPHHYDTQYCGGERSCPASPEEGKPTCSQEQLSDKSKCNSLQCPDTWIGKDSGSYLKSFPLLHPELQQLPNVRYAKEPGDKALRLFEGS